ncbi:MAG: hypothetical protein V4560_06660 [Bacteroidota bacterium]
MKNIYIFLVFSVCISMVSCIERSTTDAAKSYELWAGEKPGHGAWAIHGKYWQSAHFTKEYITYLELTVVPRWKTEYLSQSHLIVSPDSTFSISDPPLWFKPKRPYKIWKQPGNGQILCVEELASSHVFIFEAQL